MAVKASVTITISKYRDTDSITRYYKLQASTAAAPAVPTTLTPSGWSTSEPTYTSGSTNTLYYTDRVIFSDGTFQYTDDGNGKAVKSSSYEAAKEAYNKAQAAQNSATSANNKIDNLQIGGRNLLLGTGTASGDVSNGNGSKVENLDLYNGISGVKTNTWWSERYMNLKAVASRGGFNIGDNLVASVYIKSDSNITCNVSFHRSTGTGNIDGSTKTYISVTITPEWKQYWFPFVADEGSLNRTDTRIEINKSTGDNYVYWAGWKLEKGNKATDWTPAPEDMNDAIKSVVNLYYASDSSTLPAKPTAHVTTNNTSTHNAWNIGLPTYDEQYPYLYTCKEVLNKGGTYSWTTVNQTTYSEAIKTINNKIDNLQIGGRNLLKGTKDLSGATVRKTIAKDTFNGFTYIDYEVKSNPNNYIDILAWNNALKPEKEQTYTLSFWAKGTGIITSFFYPNCVKEGYNSDGRKTTAQDGQITFNLTSEWKRHWVTWKTLSNVSGWKNIIVARFNDKGIGQICAAAPKFEKGNKATDWTPAPEDMNDVIKSVVNLYYSSNSSTLPAKPTTHVTTNNTTTHNAWNIGLPTYNEQYPYLYTCKEVLNKGGTYSWTTVNQTTYSEAIKTIQTELHAVQADYLKESTFATYKRDQIENDQGIKQRLSKTELTVYGDPENPDDPKALINHIQKVDNDINGSGGLDDRLGIAEGTIEGTGLNEYDQRVKITQRFLNVETDVESIKNIFNITGGTNLVQNSVGYFASNNKPSMWDIASNTIYTPFGYDGDLTGVTVSRGKLFCAKGSITTTTNNIIALLSNKMISISFKYKNGANATSKIKIFNGSIIYFEKAFNTTVNQWTEYKFNPDTDPILANPTFLNISNSLQISIESTNSTNNNGFEISDLMLNYGNVKPWELSSNEVYGAMVKLSSLGIEVTATTANTKNFMTTDGILVYRYDSKTDKIIGTDPITKITDNGTITNKLESTGDIIERNLIQTMIKDSSNNDIYVEYIR